MRQLSMGRLDVSLSRKLWSWSAGVLLPQLRRIRKTFFFAFPMIILIVEPIIRVFPLPGGPQKVACLLSGEWVNSAIAFCWSFEATTY